MTTVIDGLVSDGLWALVQAVQGCRDYPAGVAVRRATETEEGSMGTFRFQLAVSLDRFVAGPDQSEENPLGVRGLELHQWVFPLEVWRRQQGEEGGEVNASTLVVEEAQANVGAVVMGRNMFGGGPGPWRQDPPWSGWWGDNPP